MPASYTSGQSSLSSRTSNLLSFVAKEHTVPWSLDICSTQRLPCPSSGNALHLKSRHPFVPAAQQLLSSSDDNNRSAALWADHRWNPEWLDNTTEIRTFIPGLGTHPPGMALPRVQLDRLRTAAGRFLFCLQKWDTMPVSVAQKDKQSNRLSSNIQSIDPHGVRGLTVLDDETMEWLLNTCPEI